MLNSFLRRGSTALSSPIKTEFPYRTLTASFSRSLYATDHPNRPIINSSMYPRRPLINPPASLHTTGPAYATRFNCFSCSAYNRALRYGPDGERTLCNRCYHLYTNAKLPLFLHPSGKLTAIPPFKNATSTLQYAFRYHSPHGQVLPWKNICLNPRIVCEDEDQGKTRSGNRFRLSAVGEGEEQGEDRKVILMPRLSYNCHASLLDAASGGDQSPVGGKRPRVSSSSSSDGKSKEGEERGGKTARLECDLRLNDCVQAATSNEHGSLANKSRLVRRGDETHRVGGHESVLVSGNDGRGAARQEGGSEEGAHRKASHIEHAGASMTFAQECMAKSNERGGRETEVISVKAYFTRDGDVNNSSICRFKLNTNSSFEVLLHELRRAFKVGGLLCVFYIDDEGDEVSLTSDNEMLELIDIVRRNNIFPVRMKVIPRAA